MYEVALHTHHKDRGQILKQDLLILLNNSEIYIDLTHKLPDSNYFKTANLILLPAYCMDYSMLGAAHRGNANFPVVQGVEIARKLHKEGNNTPVILYGKNNYSPEDIPDNVVQVVSQNCDLEKTLAELIDSHFSFINSCPLYHKL